MALFFIWGGVAAYFCVLWFATSLEMAIAGTIIFVFWAFKITAQALLLLAKERRDHRQAVQSLIDLTLPANQNQPPR